MAVVEEGCRDGAYPGGAALVCRRGAVAGWLVVGAAELEPTPRPMAADTLFDLASVTKVVAGTSAALFLLDTGAVCLDDPLARFLPAFATSDKRDITIRQVLTHSSGLPPWIPCYCTAATLDQTVSAIAQSELDAAPGSQLRYSDAGMILVQAVAAAVTGEPLPSLLQRVLFGPLGMRDTGYRPDGERKARAAATERGNAHEAAMVERIGLDFDRWRTEVLVGEVHDGNAHYALEGVSTHAGLFSTIGDLAHFAQLWLGRGVWQGRRVFSEPAVAEATRLQTAGLQQSFGLGWRLGTRTEVSKAPLKESGLTQAVFPPEPEAGPTPHWMGDLRSERAFGHTGFTGTSILIDPTYDLAMILLTNRVHPNAARTGVERIRARWHNAVLGAITD
jgi:CubicO group peptidase (beta-lactamase class C family)